MSEFHALTGAMLVAVLGAIDRERLDQAIRVKLDALDDDVMRRSPHAIWRIWSEER